MRDDTWTTRIEISLSRISNQPRQVACTRDAAHLLLDHWPKSRGEAYKHAVMDCARAMRGAVAHDVVQARLEDAANEAGLRFRVIDGVDSFELEIAQVCQALFHEEARLN